MKMVDHHIQIIIFQIKNYNVNTDGKNIFDQLIKDDKITYENIRKITTGQGDDFKNYKMIAIDLSKQQALDADPRAIKQINFPTNLDCAENTTMFFIVEKAKENVLDFSQGTVKVL